MSNPKNSFNDIPLFASLMYVCSTFIFNVGAIEFTLEGFGFIPKMPDLNSYVAVPLLFIFFYFYYSFHGRYKKIVEKYDKFGAPSYLHSVIISLSYVFASAFIMFIAGMFMNKSWIFENI